PHQRFDARPGPRTGRDDRRHAHPVQAVPRLPVHLLDLQRRRDVRLEDREQRRRVQRSEADRRVHRRGPGAVRADVRGQRCRAKRRQPAEGVHMSAVAPAVLSTGHAARKAKNQLATVLVTLAFGIALIPLVWLLWTVVSKGWHAITRNGWFTTPVGTRTYRDPGGGA